MLCRIMSKLPFVLCLIVGGSDLSTTLGDAGSDAVVLDVILVICLDLGADAVE
jgi:hypothetical protein